MIWSKDVKILFLDHPNYLVKKYKTFFNIYKGETRNACRHEYFYICNDILESTRMKTNFIYIKIVALNVIYNFVVEKFFI
jgi:hypothetical protein